MSESQNIEYKSNWRDEFLKWICGFANAQGGTIFIGKNDKGEIIGIEDAKRLLEDIPNKIKDTLGIIADVNLHETPEGDFIEIIVEPYPYPVSYKGQYHYRTGSTKQELTGTSLTSFLLRKTGKRWDGVPVPNVQIKDFKKETLEAFRRRAFKSQRISEDILEDTDEHLIENLHLEENGFVKKAAILLFHPNPEKFVTGAYIKIGFFQSDDELKFQDEIHGNLFEQIEKTMDILFAKYIKLNIHYEDKIYRVEKPEYPKEAIREALLNAIAHKDYSGDTPIQISVYDNKIIIWNVGQLPENWTVDNLLTKHPSKPFNPDIANALFRSGYIESWGRGTLKIIKECAVEGLPKPSFYYDMSGFFVELQKEFYNEESLNKFNLNNRQKEALIYFKNQRKMRTAEYAQKFEINERTARRDLTELVEKGLLLRIGEKKTTHYVYL